MTFDEVWDAMKGADDKDDPALDWKNNPQWPSQGNGTPPANPFDKPPCPRCKDTKEITLTMNEGDGVPTIVVRPCPLCQYPGYLSGAGGSSFKKAWDHVRK
jgi:hypothetical protein